MTLPQAVESEKHKPTLEINIGSNIFRNTNGVLKVQGKEQIVLEVTPEDNRILLTMDFYDSTGKHLAHLRRNAWGVNPADRFALATTTSSSHSLFTSASWLKVSDRETGDIVLEVSLANPKRLHLTTGKFFTHKGHLVEITSHLCRVGTSLTMFGDVFEIRGGTATLG